MAPVGLVRGAKTLLLLKLDGETSYGFRDCLQRGRDDRAVFEVTRIDPLSPAARAGVTVGDELLTVRVLGTDVNPFTWCNSAIERLEALEEVSIVQICVRKKDDARITEAQQRRHDHISQWLTKAKMLDTASKRFRGAFIVPQLQRVVVLMYEFEFLYFAKLWKKLPENEREGLTLPVPRAFVSETKLPGLMDETRCVVQTSASSTRPSTKASDMSTTESDIWSMRSRSFKRTSTQTEQSTSTPREESKADDSTSVSSYEESLLDRYLPYRFAQRTPVTKRHRTLVQHRPVRLRSSLRFQSGESVDPGSNDARSDGDAERELVRIKREAV